MRKSDERTGEINGRVGQTAAERKKRVGDKVLLPRLKCNYSVKRCIFFFFFFFHGGIFCRRPLENLKACYDMEPQNIFLTAISQSASLYFAAVVHGASTQRRSFETRSPKLGLISGVSLCWRRR